MSVNTKFGDISYHLQNFKSKGVRLIPGPPALYYELSEIDLSQRALLPKLFELAGVTAWDLPYAFFNGLLKPKDASIDRLNELLVVDNRWAQEEATPVIEAYKRIRPILQLVGDSVLSYEAKSFRQSLTDLLKK